MPRILRLAAAVAAASGLALGALAEGGAPEPPDESVVGVLPFVAGYPTRVMVDLAPEGQKSFVMMIDTGASASVVTPLMARALGVTVRRTKQSQYRRATRLGRDLLFWVDTRSSDTGSKTGWEYGLLGSDFLDEYVIEIDYPGERVRFLDPKRYAVPKQVSAPDERVLPFRRAGTRILHEIELNGKTGRALLDTGAPSGFVLSGKLAKKLGVDVASLPDFGEMGTVLGPMEVRLLETDSFRLAGFTFPQMPGLVAPRGWYNQSPNDSVIGYDVLRQFVVRIDYEHKRLWLKRTGDPRPTFQGADYATAKEIGAFLTPIGPGRFLVWGIEGDGIAAKLGLRNEDVILAALGEKPLTLGDVQERIRSQAELTVARQEGDVWIDRVLPDPLAGIGDDE